MKIPSDLNVNSRVWSIKGFNGLGKNTIDLPPHTGGTILKTTKSDTGNTLFHVLWDNKTEAVHFYSELIGIESHKTLSEFKASLRLAGPVNLTVNKDGSFLRVALFNLVGEKKQQVKLSELDRGLWKEVLRPMVEAAGLKVTTNDLFKSSSKAPSKPRRNYNK